MDKMRLVDVNAIKYREKDEYCGNGNGRPVRYVFDEDIAELPTVDAVEVVHGCTVPADQPKNVLLTEKCGICDSYMLASDAYCPGCGAKMDGGAGCGKT